MSNILKIPEIDAALRNVLMAAAEYCNGNQVKMAQALGISRGSLRKYMKEMGML